MKRTTACLVTLMLAAFSLTACGNGGNTGGNGNENGGETDPPKIVTYDTYGSYWMNNHDYKTMPVGAYNSCPPGGSGYSVSYLTAEQTFKDYADAGVNTMMGLTDYVGQYNADVLTALDYCAEYGLSYLVAYAGAGGVANESGPRSALTRIKYHDAFGGIMLSDEPGKVMFDDIATAKGIFESVMADGYGEKLMHANLFPDYATAKQLYYRIVDSSTPSVDYTYRQYVDDYVEAYSPQVLSYDNYPIGRGTDLGSTYFTNMSVIRKKALEENIPFWVFVQTCTFYNGQRLPNLGELSWNVNTCLAYGAKGIQYFTGVLPQNGAENFNGAMFDRDGNKTEIYEYVKEVNKQIAAVDEILMCAASKGVIVSGLTPISSGTSRLEIPESDRLTEYGALTSVSGEHTLTGCFDYNGKAAFYVVNNSISETDSVTLSFSQSVNGYSVKSTAKQNFSGSSLALELGIGEGVLVVLE